ncbi:MAG: TrbG/VirB9 family P-type conjugative transfer protein [Candidatus Omnitrophota bacterium]|nr:TrbG/VirB9 family P-type conjugative transfer protein [Candidatus Omnitrophota bacterium]
MKYLILIFLLCITTPLWADSRYLPNDKVLYENPQEQDVLKVNTAMGYCTVLEFPDKPTMVSVGDNSMIQIEVPQNSKSIVIKPLEESGETNLFVFTANQRFNYKVIIGDEHQVDYVIDTKESAPAKTKDRRPVTVGEFIKMARNYPVLNELGNINKRDFIHKDLMYQCTNPKFDVNVIEAFSYKNPHHVILHLKVRNVTSDVYELKEKNTNVYVNGQKFQPQYVAFDDTQLKSGSSTEAWLILAGTYISLDNKFTFGIGVGHAEGICY